MRNIIQQKWPNNYSEAVEIQNRLKNKVILSDKLPAKIRTIGGVDVSYSKKSDRLFATIVVLSYPDLEPIEFSTAKGRARFPYIPGLLSFRETPFVIKAFEKLKTIPDILIFDGQGYAHPRRFGLASHAGVILKLPTIGCAKSRLIGEYREPSLRKGAYSKLHDSGELIGLVVRSKDRVKPLFVSSGHMVSLDKSREIVFSCCGKYRLPEPTRIAHIKSNMARMESRI
jgi:deoxyribonuclease V